MTAERPLTVLVVAGADGPPQEHALAVWRTRLAPLAPRAVLGELPLGGTLAGDLLLVPADAGLPAGLLAGLRDVHLAEGNAATLLTAEHPGPARVVRDDLGRVTALAPSGTARGAAEFAVGVAMVRLADLPAGSIAQCTGPVGAPSELAGLVQGLRDRGRPVGAWGGLRGRPPGGAAGGRPRPDEVEAEAAAPCACCAAEPRSDPATGVLVVRSRACLAVDPHGFNSGQLLCYPRRHVTCAALLDDEEHAQLAALLIEGERRLRRVYDFDAINIGAESGLGGHLVYRLIPRWTGDLNFLPLAGGFKPVPESPLAAWHRLQGEAS